MHNSFWFQVVVGACAVFVGNRVEPRVKKRVTNIVMAWIVTFAITVVVTLPHSKDKVAVWASPLTNKHTSTYT